MTARIHRNMGLREALRLARELGCTVIQNEEHVVSHPSWRNRVRVHVGRKDVSAELLSRLRRLIGRTPE